MILKKDRHEDTWASMHLTATVGYILQINDGKVQYESCFIFGRNA